MISEIFSAESFFWSCLWQSTIFIAAGLLGSFILRHRSARAHQVLLLAIIAAVTVPVISILVKHYELGLFAAKTAIIQSQPEDQIIYETAGTTSLENPEHKLGTVEKDLTSVITAPESSKFPLRSVVLYGWLVASLVLATRLLITFILGVRLLGLATPLDCDNIEQAVHLAKAKLRIDKDVSFYSSRGVQSPVIWCWKRSPILLLPSAAGQSDNRIDWAGVLCHELAHYKRRDHISGLLTELLVCIMPWHPLLWWAKSRLIGLSEQACDDWVVATGQPCTNYAESLLDLIPCGQMAFVPAVVSSKKGLAGRIQRILKNNCPNPRTGAVWALTVTIVAVCLTIGVALAQARPAVQSSAVQDIIVPTMTLAEPDNPNNVESNVIVLRLVDSNGRPVAGAKVGTNVSTSDALVLGSRLSWFLRSQENNISNELGEITLTREKLFITSWPADRKRALYVLHEDRQIGSKCMISKDGKKEEIELTLEPVCHVHGKLGSEGLKKIGRPLIGTNVYMYWDRDSFGVLSHASEKQLFDFFVPPGRYTLHTYGSGEGASSKHLYPEIEVKANQSELDLGVIDLPPTKLASFIGKPAIEFGPIKAWKNGPPVKLADLKSKAVIIYFDGDSPNTSRDLPRFVDLHEQLADKGLVIIALYNCADMEDLENKWVEIYEKFGGVTDVPFRVAIDGGEPTFYEGTNKKRLGATYGAYDITIDPTTMLIDPEGKVVGKLSLHKAKEILEEMLGVKPALPTWRQRFDRVYRLDPKQVIKRISPPFIPERRDYYLNEHSQQASHVSRSPDRFTFHWDGKLKNWGLGFINTPDIDSTLRSVLRMNTFEYEGPEELLSLKLPGDWVVRDEASQEVKLKALEQLLADELGRSIQFEKRIVEQEVILAAGRFKFHPVSGARKQDVVHLYVDELSTSGGGTAHSVAELLHKIGNRANIYVVDRTEPSEENNIPYYIHRSSRDLRRMESSPEKTEKLKPFLANLTEQTELQFEVALQPVETWVVSENKEN
ncbi:MAG: redoxin domain-containing protein [Planctomycetes bacterium]|nr:redoxin domain-containing protein [Planctomycetota bacterium]